MKKILILINLFFFHFAFAEQKTLVVHNNQIKVTALEFIYRAPILDKDIPVCHVDFIKRHEILPEFDGNTSVFNYDLIRKYSVKDCHYRLLTVNLKLSINEFNTDRAYTISFRRSEEPSSFDKTLKMNCLNRQYPSMVSSNEVIDFRCLDSNMRTYFNFNFLDESPLPEQIILNYLPPQINPTTADNLLASFGTKNIKVSIYKNENGQIGANSPIVITGIPHINIKDLVINYSFPRLQVNQISIPSLMEADSRGFFPDPGFLEIFVKTPEIPIPEYIKCSVATPLAIVEHKLGQQPNYYCVD